jgi:serine/threonine protein kinase/WD40 repeat protein
MPSHPSGRCNARKLLDQFEEAWQQGMELRIEDVLAQTPASGDNGTRRELLEELIKIDLEYRWRRKCTGVKPLKLEDYVGRFPELGPLDRLPTPLIAQEYEARQSWGDRPDHAEYAARFPRQAAKLGQILPEIDADLAVEFVVREAKELPGRHPSDDGRAPVPTITSVATVLATATQCGLLSPGQLAELTPHFAARLAEPRLLAKELLQRGWLTPYQINQLLQGRGRDLVLGGYVLLERLGEGGAGQVFKARHQKLGRFAALKIIRPELLTEAEVVARFYREIQVLSKLDHPNIVHAFDAGPAGATHYLAMEYVEGSDLGRLVKQGGPMPVQQACEYIRQAALGLQHAHERGLVHRDIKPHNLIMSVRDGLIKVADLGLARLPRSVGAEVTSALTGVVRTTGTLTPENAMLMGTADYLAPEQALDFHKADIRADIYSMGCTLYYLLAGQPPFAGGNLAEKVAKHQQAEAAPLEQFRKDVPRGLSAALRKMLAKRPADRFQTPAELAKALAPFALNDSRTTAISVYEKKRRAALAIGAVALLALGLFVGWRTLTRPESFLANKGVSEFPLKKQHVVHAVAFGPNGKLVAAGGDVPVDGKFPITLWDTATGQEQFTLEGHKEPIHYLAFSPDGRYLASGGGTRMLWDLYTRKLLHTFPADPKIQPAHAYIGPFSPDGKYLALRHGKDSLILADVASVAAGRFDPSQRTNVTINKVEPSALAINPDSRAIALGLGGADVYDVATQKTSHFWSGGNIVGALAFTPDKTRLAVGANRSVLVHWLEPVGHKEPYVMWKANEDGLVTLGFSPNGQMLATGGSDRMVRLWDPATGKELHKPLQGHTKAVRAIAFSAGGNTLFTAGEDDTVRIWRIGE